MGFTNFARDKFMAPELSKLTECNLRDLSDLCAQSDAQVRNFILNSAFRVTVKQPHRAYVFMFLRRVDGLAHEYENARSWLADYISGNRDSISKYLRAVLHLETALAQAWQAYQLASRMAGMKGKVFERGEDDPQENLNTVHNASKHADERIEKGEVPGDTTMPMWLTNEGICCKRGTLSFVEFTGIVEQLAKWGEALSNPPVPKREAEGDA